MSNIEEQRRERMRNVARAIGRVVTHGEVEPQKGWLEAAEAAIKAYHESWVYEFPSGKNWPT